MQTVSAFWPSKVLLTAVGLGLFTKLGRQSMTAAELGNALGLHPRGWYDFFDALVALKFLERDGDGPGGRYRNTLDTGTFLDKAYIGGIADMMNTRLYRFWGELETALKTGQPQNEVKQGGNMFAELFADPARLATFLEAMSGFQAGNFMALAEKFDWSRFKTVSDIGGALALLSRLVGARHKHLSFTTSPPRR
jgi:hypothetical protein